MNRTWRTIGIIAFLALALLKFVLYLDRPRTTAQRVKEDFEKEWHYAEPQEEESLLRKFKKYSKAPCSNIYIKKSLDKGEETLIACTEDGINYYYYINGHTDWAFDSLRPDGITKPTLY